MILTDRQIVEAQERGDILIEPFEQKQVQAATYDLRVGDQAASTSTKKKVDVKADGYVSITPGDFAVVTVLERLRLANGDQTRTVASLAMQRGPSVDFCGYWQRHVEVSRRPA